MNVVLLNPSSISMTITSMQEEPTCIIDLKSGMDSNEDRLPNCTEMCKRWALRVNGTARHGFADHSGQRASGPHHVAKAHLPME